MSHDTVKASCHQVGVDYLKIVRALNFYASRGYRRVEVPWLASAKAMAITTPDTTWSSDGTPILGRECPRLGNGFLVASAEQSFIHMIQAGCGKYSQTWPHPDHGEKVMAVTPCYRDESMYSELHYPGFLKLELLYRFQHPIRRQEAMDEVIKDARDFLSGYTDGIKTEETPAGYDLNLDGVEVGSYGSRMEGSWEFIYGTGLAEPRFSQLLAAHPPGYAVADVRRGTLGELDKIEEELDELRDAMAQDNPIMAQVEASDLLGALTHFIKHQFPGITMRDVRAMAAATERAFTSGRRKPK